MIMIFISMILMAWQKLSSVWSGTLDHDKCKIPKANKNTFKDYDYVMQDHYLLSMSHWKGNWVIFNSRLYFDEHVIDKVSKANNMFGLIRRTIAFMDELSLVQLYIAFIWPHLVYSICG